MSEVTSIQPGKPFHVGLHLNHQEHYHTYWKFSGIVGVPTDMAWNLPPGWKAEPIEWPAPERVMMFQIKAQGFHGEVLLPMKLTPPNDLEPGANVTLKGKATWMCCGRDCNPGFADLSVTLPVDKLPPPIDMRWQKLFSKARAATARPLEGWDATAIRVGERVTLRLTPKANQSDASPRTEVPILKNDAGTTPRRPNLFQRLFGGSNPSDSGSQPKPSGKPPGPPPPGIFFTEDGYINADKDQVFRADGESLVVELIVSQYFTEKPPAELRGILWLKDGSLGKGAIIRAPFAK